MIPTTVTSSSPSTASSSSNNSASANNSNSSSNDNNNQQQQQQTAMATATPTPAPSTQNSSTAMLGIAALILEGRAIAEDEYHQPQVAPAPPAARVPAEALESFFGSASSGGASIATSGFAGATNYQAGVAAASAAGRQSPKPSTSRAAFGNSGSSGIGSSGGNIINITTNPHAFGAMGSPMAAAAIGVGVTTPHFIDHYNSSGSAAAAAAGGSASSSSSSSSTAAESLHMRWTQKLCALRQASPTASINAVCKQKVSVEAQSSGEPELVALAINENSASERNSSSVGDFEIVRRVILQRHANMGSGGGAAVTTCASSGGNVSTSPGSGAATVGPVGGADNFLHSLQSLATTCLRGSNPSASPLTPQVGATAATAASPQSASKYNTYRATSSTPPSRFQSPTYTAMEIGGGSASSSGSGIQSPRAAWSPVGATTTASSSSGGGGGSSSSIQYHHQHKDKFLRHNSVRMPIPATVTSAAAASATTAIPNLASAKGAAAAATVTAATGAAAPSQQPTASSSTTPPTTRYPQQGPHCDQFLRKMGLAKGEAADAEDHFCDMSYVNITCSRWRVYCLKMETIIASGVPVCIEVYLGPMSHKILLEQWIITQKEKVPPPTMTLPSLCSAIRSQLYFSQISAWCDLIKKSDKTIYDTGRIVFATTTTTAAGDLATTSTTTAAPTSSMGMPTAAAGATHNQASATVVSSVSATASPLNQLTNAMMLNNCRPRLNIFYRIRPYDSTACFNSKPNVHNFPNVNITENFSISVCLKSLPRINGGIPNCAGVVAVGTAQPAPVSAAVIAMPTTSSSGGGGVSSEANGTNGATPRSAAVSNGAGASSNPAAAGVETPRSSRSLIATIPSAASATAANATLNCDKPNRKTMRSALHCYTPQAPLIMPTVEAAATTTTAATLSAAATIAAAVADANGSANHAKSMFFIDEEELEEADDVDGAAKKTDAAACKNDDDDDEDEDYDDVDDDNESATGVGDSSNSSLSSANANSLSHRERQLLKYRKRMQKRDKKRVSGGSVGCSGSGTGSKPTTLHSTAASDASCELSTAELVAYHQPTAMVRNHRNSNGNNNISSSSAGCAQHCCSGRGQPMEQGEEEEDEVAVEDDASAVTARRIEMISTGTQTPLTSCQQCGSVKTLICLKCNSSSSSSNGGGACYNSAKIDLDEMDDSTSTSSSISSGDIIHTPRNNAELLLQAIQRTPKAAKKHKKQTLRAAAAAANSSSTSALQNNNHLSELPAMSLVVTNGGGGGSCQVCKRQKTQHNFSAAATARRRSHEFSATLPTTTASMSGVDDSVDALVSAAEFTVEAAKQEADGDETDEAAGRGSYNNNNSQHNDNGDNDGANDGDEVDDAFNRMRYYPHAQQQTPPYACNSPAAGCTLAVPMPVPAQPIEEIFGSPQHESYITSTKLTPHIERCSLSSSSSMANLRNGAAGDHHSHAAARRQHFMRSCTPPVEQRCPLPDEVTPAQFKTPTNVPSPQQQKLAVPFHHHQQTPKPNLLLLTSSCNYHSSCGGGGGDGQHDAASTNGVAGLAANSATPMYETITPTGGAYHNPQLRKALPKVNLTPLFCSPNPAQTGISSASSTAAMGGRLSAPIPIHSCRSAPDTSTAAAAAANTFFFEASPTASVGGNVDNCVACIPVQKSYSAPTLPNSPSLSPRFAKQAAIYKRRSRHLSDRSDRSSLGSDELLSDEELENGVGGGLYGSGVGGSPATSPLKQRSRIAAFFGRLPLLGNLEESLLQRRLVPKIEVVGFKVLLGASGGFCPTQLNIPAAAFFYELHGETLSTPYVCDIRLPRKGYSVPRAGNVQATLLNPMGTVVRMFVIPYDMRDMPPLHQTFIRQRVLAEASTNETATLQNGNGNGSSNLNGGGGQMNGFGGGGSSNNNNKYRLSPSGGLHGESNLGHFISAEHMKRLRYSIHLRFQTSRSGRLSLHTDIRLLISRRTDCDTAAAHAKGVLEAPNDLVTDTVMPSNPKYSARQEPPNRI